MSPLTTALTLFQLVYVSRSAFPLYHQIAGLMTMMSAVAIRQE
jgi:hypothetical protein